ncbi:MAG: hypothetical protein AAFN43_07955, partial [Pseudomonadota bacterium]
MAVASAKKSDIAVANAKAAPLLRVLNVETYYGAVMALRGVSMDVHNAQKRRSFGICHSDVGFFRG